MKVESNALLEDLRNITLNILKQAKELNELEMQNLNHKSNEESWSVLECLEHLNRYGRFYIPEMEQRIKAFKGKVNPFFVSGRVGNYFAKSMRPRSNMKKINTFKSMNPIGSKLDKEVIEEFIRHQKQILEILDNAKNVDLSKTKTSVSISKWIKLKLGDTLRVVIYHNQRHMLQAFRALP